MATLLRLGYGSMADDWVSVRAPTLVVSPRGQVRIPELVTEFRLVRSLPPFSYCDPDGSNQETTFSGHVATHGRTRV